MAKQTGSFSKSVLSFLIASAFFARGVYAHDDDHIRRSGEAFIAQSTIDTVITTVGSTGPLSPMGWPPIEVVNSSVALPPFFSAEISSAMTQGTYNGSNSEANLTALSFLLPISPETYFRANELKVQAYAYCDGRKAVVFGSTDLDEALVTTSPNQLILATGKVNQQVSLPSGAGNLVINEQVVTGYYSYKKIVVNGLHFSGPNFDLILGHVEADVKCPYDLAVSSAQ
jgi:hypothetical protein